MTATIDNTDSSLRPLTPQEIGRFIKITRILHGWTQETLADLSGLQTRTIQRVEQGQPSSFDTRRALARALKLDDIDFLSSPKNFPSDEEIQKQKEVFDREHVLLDVQEVNGRQLFSHMQEGPKFRMLGATSMAELPRGVQDSFAAIVDFVRDGLDILDIASHGEVLGYGDTLDENIAELKSAGFCLCVAFRNTKITNGSWADKTPLLCQITYLLASSKDQPVTKVAVARKVSAGL